MLTKYPNAKHPQMSVWKISDRSDFSYDDKLGETSHIETSHPNEPTDDVTNIEKAGDNKKSNLLGPCVPYCCSSPVPFVIGLFLGILVGSIALNIVLSLWLVSSKTTAKIDSSIRTTTTTSTTKTSATTTSATTTTTFTTATTATTTTTTSRPLIALNQQDDIIYGLYNTTAGEDTGGFNGSYSWISEMPPYGMDNSTATKYLNFGGFHSPNAILHNPGVGTGFIVIPAISTTTVACGLLFATANDFPNRDPISVTLEGSNETYLPKLHLGSSWVLLYNGSTGINSKANQSRLTYAPQQNFSNTRPFASYRLLVTSQRGNGSAVQYSEARILGYV